MKKLRIFLLFFLFGAFFMGGAQVQAVKGTCTMTTGGLTQPMDSFYFSTDTFNIYQERAGEQCYYPGSCIEAGEVVISVKDITFYGEESFTHGKFHVGALSENGAIMGSCDDLAISNDGTLEECRLNVTGGNDGSLGRVFVNYWAHGSGLINSGIIINCELRSQDQFLVYASCGADDQCSTLPVEGDGAGWELCMQIPAASNKREVCSQCMSGGGLWTAIGCIPTSPEAIIKTIVQVGLSIAGLVVLVMILIGSFMLSTSQGDPNKTKEAKEIISSAVIGLLFIIFSVTILQLIGVSILRIPGFGE